MDIENIGTVRKNELQEQVYRVVKNAVLSGQIQRDRIYSVKQLAQILNVSRTPVAGAVQTLSKEGLISTLSNQGFRIYQFLENDVRDIFELRKAVEGYIVERVIEMNVDTLDIHKHLDAQKNYLAEEDVTSFLNEDRKFHMVWAEKLNNNRILQALNNIRDLVGIMNLEVMAEVKRGQQVIKEHTNILEAIDTRNKTAAKRALYHHFDHTVDILRQRITKV